MISATIVWFFFLLCYERQGELGHLSLARRKGGTDRVGVTPTHPTLWVEEHTFSGMSLVVDFLPEIFLDMKFVTYTEKILIFSQRGDSLTDNQKETLE